MFRIINNLKNRKGFTLIELIVVLAVLAIIMAIALPRFLGIQEDAKEDSDHQTIELIARAAELYFVRENEPDEDEVTVDELITANYFQEVEFQSKLYVDNGVVDGDDLDIEYNHTTGIVTITSGTGATALELYPDNDLRDSDTD
jgi:type IV pilus assembly protein PilA